MCSFLNQCNLFPQTLLGALGLSQTIEGTPELDLFSSFFWLFPLENLLETLHNGNVVAGTTGENKMEKNWAERQKSVSADLCPVFTAYPFLVSLLTHSVSHPIYAS